MRCLNSELWHACAGPLLCLPTIGGRVVYVAQGHSEQSSCCNLTVSCQLSSAKCLHLHAFGPSVARAVNITASSPFSPLFGISSSFFIFFFSLNPSSPFATVKQMGIVKLADEVLGMEVRKLKKTTSSTCRSIIATVTSSSADVVD
ncbi:uncharacterized protein A4U43_C04F4580 [Asparagus officinalis]|uniref:Uncharacterized protein n=1 Tax=Asparagus officinalis TaxID=4686 RepID=A0A5P1EYC2_ASPOF|nr:uncharacterized protein A4U43_C04F4580 [Asparagus officinalis]